MTKLSLVEASMLDNEVYPNSLSTINLSTESKLRGQRVYIMVHESGFDSCVVCT